MTATAFLGFDAWTAAAPPLANHLWQSTLFAFAAALLAWVLRNNGADPRYWLWLAASVKFLLPFTLLVAAGRSIEWRSAPSAPLLSHAIEQVSEPFALAPAPAAALREASGSPSAVPALFAGLWLLGSVFVLSMQCTRWLRISKALRGASPLPIAAPIPVMSSRSLFEPGVFGVVRPVLLLPEGIADRLTARQLEAILAHELCHVRRRDNLTAAAHMLVEALFWFHPLVWWIGARMIAERERACDEEVLRLGSEPEVYAQGILDVCRSYLSSDLACAPGVTGADLKERIERIMTCRLGGNLTAARKVLIAGAAAAAIALPLAVVLARSSQETAPAAPALTFEVTSIKPADRDARGMTLQLQPGGGLRAVNVRLRALIEFAYDVDRSRISGGPGWFESEGFDIIAKGRGGEDSAAPGPRSREQVQEVRQRLQALLADRFQLKVHRDPKEVSLYALVVAKNGHKLRESEEGYGINRNRGLMTGKGATVEMIAHVLTSILGRPVVDRTGLAGRYEFKLEWTEEMVGPMGKDGPVDAALEARPDDATGPSIFSALQEQLGLKLESQKGPVDIIVIDRAERPSVN